MKYFSRLGKKVELQTVAWHDSKTLPGARFAIRRVSLGARLELTSRARELALKHEFLRAGDAADQLEASLADLLVKQMYLEWGLHALEGVCVDGKKLCPAEVVKKAPEFFSDEVLDALRAELGLTEDERKNS